MKPAGLHGSSAVFMGATAAALLAQRPAMALDLIFVLDGVSGTLHSLEAGVMTNFPTGEVEINFGPAKGF